MLRWKTLEKAEVLRHLRSDAQSICHLTVVVRTWETAPNATGAPLQLT